MTQHFRRETLTHQESSGDGPKDAKFKVLVLNPWGSFGQYGERAILENAGCAVEIVEDRTEEGILRAVRDIDGLYFTGPVSRKMLLAMNQCKVMAASSIGMDTFEDFDLATEKGIVVCNCPGVFVDEVANQGMALLLACVRWLVPTANFVKEGSWADRSRERPWGYIHRMTGQTIGIVGLGDIGKAMAQRAAGFGLRVLAHDPYIPAETFKAHGAESVSMGKLLQDSDFISLHVPLNKETRHLISGPQFALMKPEAILINTCRGPVVDEAALITALQNGRILAAGLDVTEVEPVASDNPLLKMDNVVISPHMASISEWANGERRRRPAQEIAAALTGHQPRAVWNKEVLEHLNLK
ncbi:MAG: D-3-phosphoglycerate dehydrogenase [uncultured Thermomicrobiales bacterium]|uniref:D-3-phosphoglycerate dehydrogenase n=1 Tax=uncultured Thermomicrobiales bacterium TaxID=1645740 RepID=A0A6J4VMP0_9BACT|nr:MAG: D-3-phosphoglycerate dehydrogenase [uncultured Thermomicrobiales bacterium]